MYRRILRVLRSLWPHSLLLLSCAGLLLMLLGALWYDNAHRPYVSNDFVYTATIDSTDNLYDAENQRYSGARYTKNKLTYTALPTSNGLWVKNTLDSIDAMGASATMITKTGLVNAHTGEYLADTKQNESTGYLFAPRGLSKGQDFYYRHITYDAPVHMLYQGEKQRYGLTTYHYKGSFDHTERIEQRDGSSTAPAEHLGLEYAPSLDIWVEPVSGWLIDYQENSVVHSYHKETGAIVSPISRFARHMTEESVQQQATYASDLRFRMTFAAQMPGLILLVLLLCAVAAFVSRCTAPYLPIYLAVLGLATTVILSGWVNNNPLLINLLGGNATFNQAAALGFVVIAGIVWTRHTQVLRRISLGASVLLTLFFGLSALGIAGITPFQPDSWVTIPAHPAPLSLLTAFIFVICGAGLIAACLPGHKRNARLAPFLAGMVVVIGILSVALQMLHINHLISLSSDYRVAISDAVLFIVANLSLLQTFRLQKNRDTSFRTILRDLSQPALAVIPLLLIAAVAQFQQGILHQQLQTVFDDRTRQIESHLSGRLQSLASLTNETSRLGANSPQADALEWHHYIDGLHLDQHHPELQAIAFSKVATTSELEHLTISMQRDAQPSFTVFPQSVRPQHAIILYGSTTKGPDKKLAGYDLRTDNTLSEAMDNARLDTPPSISAELQPAAAINPTNATMLAIFSPVPAENPTTPSPAGYIVAIFDVKKLIESSLSSMPQDVNVRIYDGLDTQNATELYQRFATPESPPRFSTLRTIQAQQRTWTISYASMDSFALTASEEHASPITFIIGSLSYLACLIFWRRGNSSRIISGRAHHA